MIWQEGRDDWKPVRKVRGSFRGEGEGPCRWTTTTGWRLALDLAAAVAGPSSRTRWSGPSSSATGACVGEGWHQRFGGPHAEVDALAAAGDAARGATLYVTLEPCCHHGKTPPCTDAVLRPACARVVAAMADPFPKVAGGGVAALRGGRRRRSRSACCEARGRARSTPRT